MINSARLDILARMSAKQFMEHILQIQDKQIFITHVLFALIITSVQNLVQQHNRVIRQFFSVFIGIVPAMICVPRSVMLTRKKIQKWNKNWHRSLMKH